MAETLLTREQVENRYGFSPNCLRKLVKQGDFPRPIQIGQKLLRWRLSTIDEFIASKDAELNSHMIPTQEHQPCNWLLKSRLTQQLQRNHQLMNSLPKLGNRTELIRKAVSMSPQAEQPPTKRKKRRNYPALKVVKHILPTDSKIVQVRKMTVANIKLSK